MTDIPPQSSAGSVIEQLKYYTEERDKLLKFSLFSSGVSLLLAAASRLPTWEVSSPVASLVGTVNVGFLPIFGPIFIFGTFLYALQRRSILAAMWRVFARDDRFDEAFPRAAVDREDASVRRRVIRWGFDVWLLVVPIIAYAILLCTYFDFVRPMKDKPNEYVYKQWPNQIADLMFGIGGWTGFAPIAPSIHDNLIALSNQTDAKEKARLQRVAQQVPWIYPPLQTWAYLGGWITMLWIAWGVRRDEARI